MPPSPQSKHPDRSQFVICLAGHIDHGKSALVQALTGSKMDRLPEEKRRGITIDLGFAHFDAEGARFALIDVPGHEKFIHAMVAGASGVDAALLVVAADDSVMPQTREHLAVLELLGIRSGVIAITKCDLADKETLGLVEMEIDELVYGTCLRKAPRLRVSAHKNEGIEELKQALIACAKSAPPRPTGDTRFRLPIDRTFSPEGQGTVVTGTVWRGTAHVGDTLALLPANESVRIRRLQSQGKDVESVAAGERAAVNLVGVKASAIHRGDELATPGAFEPGKRHLALVCLLDNVKHPLKHRQFVRLHVGANQVTAQVLLEERELSPPHKGYAILRCKDPIVVDYGQLFVLRQLSPAETIGGGMILLPALRQEDRVKRTLAAGNHLRSPNPITRLLGFIELRREITVSEVSQSRLDLDATELDTALSRLLAEKMIVRSADPQPCYVTTERFQQLKQKLLRVCRQELERRKPASQVPLAPIIAAMSHHASEGILNIVLADMVAHRELVRRGDRIGLPSGAQLSQRQRQLLTQLLSEFSTAGRAPPTDKELAEKLRLPPRDLAALLQVALDDGHLVRVSPQMSIDRDALEGLRSSLAEHFHRQSTAKVGELREQWGITRKHAVPIFEYFDQCRITLRNGDLRSAGPQLSIPIGESSA